MVAHVKGAERPGDIMNDLIFIAVMAGFFIVARAVCAFLREALGGSFMWNIIVGIISVLLFIYLFVAMIRPEKF